VVVCTLERLMVSLRRGVISEHIVLLSHTVLCTHVRAGCARAQHAAAHGRRSRCVMCVSCGHLSLLLLREAAPHVRHHFVLLRQVLEHQLLERREPVLRTAATTAYLKLTASGQMQAINRLRQPEVSLLWTPSPLSAQIHMAGSDSSGLDTQPQAGSIGMGAPSE